MGILLYGIWVFMGILFLCLVRCFSMIIWTPTVLSVLYACVLYFRICNCSAQLSMFHMERRSRNTLIIIIIIITMMMMIMIIIIIIIIIERRNSRFSTISSLGSGLQIHATGV